ncbi:MAG: DNA repair exonuclease [Bacteroidales bacterium]|nr:DNA repair exonuclease [Bacteroidales bacterium]
MIRFIHTGDLHLDTPFKGLSNVNQELAGRLKDATFKSFQKIIDICIEESVDFLLITGDIFDSEIQSLAAQLRFVKELEKLSSRGIPAYMICGNHDPLNSWLEELKLPENVFRFGASQVECFTYEKDGKPLADICGISYGTKTENRSLANAYERKKNPAPFSIALLHGTIGSAGAHENYVPFRLEDVKSKGFDYWALGHIHKHHVVHPAYPAIVYPGNPQGRDFGEAGPRGCYRVILTENQAPEITFAPTQFIRFEEVIVDLTGLDSIGELPDRILRVVDEIAGYQQDSSRILRITLKGRSPLHGLLHRPGEAEDLLNVLNEGQLQQEYFTLFDRIILHTLPDVDLKELKEANDFTAEILKSFDRLDSDSEKYNELFSALEQEFGSQPAKRELDDLSDEEKKEILESARWMLVDQLIKDKS